MPEEESFAVLVRIMEDYRFSFPATSNIIITIRYQIIIDNVQCLMFITECERCSNPQWQSLACVCTRLPKMPSKQISKISKHPNICVDSAFHKSCSYVEMN